jgi:hypothetical protein
MSKLLGIIGLLIVCAGVDLLWQSRREIRFWLGAYLNVLRSALRQQGTPFHSFPASIAPEKRHGAVRFLLGLSFAFLLGPLLIVVSLTLMLYKS